MDNHEAVKQQLAGLEDEYAATWQWLALVAAADLRFDNLRKQHAWDEPTAEAFETLRRLEREMWALRERM